MKLDNKVRLIAVLSAVLLTQSLPNTYAKPKTRPATPIIYDVVHAIPAGFGADIVDIYANGKLIVDNAAPGAVAAITGESGYLSVAIYANGVVPGPTTSPVLTTDPVYLSTNSKYSFVAHLNPDETPHLTAFRNITTEPGSKRSWITVRNVAASPELYLKVNGERTFIPLASGIERKKSYVFETYTATAALTETGTAVAGPNTVALKKGTNVILYIWGAKSKNNLAFLKEEIPAR